MNNMFPLNHTQQENHTTFSSPHGEAGRGFLPFRAEHMGLAMLFIMLFHIPLAMSDPFYGLKRMGNIGVDIFLFLSGIGLAHSWNKQRSSLQHTSASNPSPLLLQTHFVRRSEQARAWRGLGRFYRRRILRLYPAWLIVAFIYYVVLHYNHRPLYTLGELLFGYGFWQRDELAFWFIPAILVLYLVTPFILELQRRYKAARWLFLLAIAWCFAVQYVPAIHAAVGHLEIFWSRVPIFLLGLTLPTWMSPAEIKKEKIKDGTPPQQEKHIKYSSPWGRLGGVLLLLFCIWLEQTHHGQFPIFYERLLYIPIVLAWVLLTPPLFRRLPALLLRALAWIGGISLECYLLHVQIVMMVIMRPHIHAPLHYWTYAIISIALTLPLAKLLSVLTKPKTFHF